MTKTLGLRAGPIAIGSAVSIIGGFLTSMVIGTVYVAILMKQGVAPEQMESRIQSDSSLYVISLPLGLAFSVWGGYLTAKRTPDYEIPNALATGAVIIVFAALMYLLSNSMDAVPKWYTIAAFVLTLPAAWLGGTVAQERTPQSAA